ncbi:hypothetical protein [Streptomyces jeddahensis]|uniref:Chaplin domain-containing protein n=1 Tax=Streptomyces jeddahensis TaxID=1716141 RepID=A0A177HNN3_9ACTN|nr:hypothetical protein [Streptomyces jeddahensis]OAH12611.1 hypothetical protein STSP_39570 [Streptomyces jeddahensis]
MRIRTTVAAAALAAGAVFGGAGAAVADTNAPRDIDIDIPGFSITIPSIVLPDDIADLPSAVCNAVVGAIQAFDPDFTYICPAGPTG